MNEFKWAKGIKDLFSGDRNKADFSKFIDEVSVACLLRKSINFHRYVLLLSGQQ